MSIATRPQFPPRSSAAECTLGIKTMTNMPLERRGEDLGPISINI
jgi:hypothetical protein